MNIPEERRVPCLQIRYEPCERDARVSRVGGMPTRWETGDVWPSCTGCREPLNFLAQVVGPLSVGALTLADDEALQIFACLHEEACSPETARGFCRSVSDGVAAIPQMPEDSEESFDVFPAFGMVVTDGFDDSLAADDPHAAGWQDAFRHGWGDKIGGIQIGGNAPRRRPTFPMVVQLRDAKGEKVLPGYGGSFFAYLDVETREVFVYWS